MSRRAKLWGALGILLLLLVNIVTVSVGGDESSLTVSNRTEHFLHVIVNNQPFLYVAPDRSVTYTSGATPTVHVATFYAPGQGVTGSVELDVEIPYQGSRTGCTCQEGDGWGDCVTTPAAGGSAHLEIEPDQLQP